MGFWSFIPHRLPWHRRLLNRLSHQYHLLRHRRRQPSFRAFQFVAVCIILISLGFSLTLHFSLDSRRRAGQVPARYMLVEFVSNPATGTISINRASRTTATSLPPNIFIPTGSYTRTIQVSQNGSAPTTIPLTFLQSIPVDNFDKLANPSVSSSSYPTTYTFPKPTALAIIPYTSATSMAVNSSSGQMQKIDTAALTVAAAEPLPAVLAIEDDGSPTTFDILFIADSYTDFTQFHQDAQDMFNLFISVEPFSQFTDSIKLLMADNAANLGCYQPPDIPRLIVCDRYLIFLAALTHNFDSIIVVHNSNEYGGSGSPGVAVTYRDVNTLAAQVMVHEFGHSFGNLMDEYSYNSSFPTGQEVPWANCDWYPCIKWSGIPDTDCFSTCGYINLSRSTDNDSLMRTLIPDHGFRFGPVSEAHLYDLLTEYIPLPFNPDADQDQDIDYLDYLDLIQTYSQKNLFYFNTLLSSLHR